MVCESKALTNRDDYTSTSPALSLKKEGSVSDDGTAAPHLPPAPPPVEEDPELIKQPETRPISQEQLVAEVKGIYTGLVMVENKCIEVDNDRSSQNDASNKLNNDQWQALIALHRTLLHEHYNFFLASQHPSASPALRRLAAKYAMPAWMWRQTLPSSRNPRSSFRTPAALLLYEARLPPTELHFVRAYGILFNRKQHEELEPTIDEFLKLLDNYINRSTRRWRESGYHMGISNIYAILGYGDANSPITCALKITRSSGTESQDQPMQETSSEITSSINTIADDGYFYNARKLFTGTYDIVCRRFGDPNILPFLHVTLVFVHHLTFYPEAIDHLAPYFSWKLTAYMLNTLIGSSSSPSADESQALAGLLGGGEQFPGWKGDKDEENKVKRDEKEGGPPARGPRRRPLPDDFALRGFSWVEHYFPDGWFVADERIDDNDKYFEVPSMMEERRERVVWLGCRIAEREDGKWLRFDKETRRFAVNAVFDVQLDLEMPLPSIPGESVDYGELPDVETVA
ncbi:uncharacterized protein B0T15DRAFT_559038 [Chaetomium strumarium]|uniref:DNA/RNA-binding domain-containing protein n=1 Tax=Chaetomium strumarium TaxID=1170767 RepID=A0AAJ0GS77_9PEZI|nr:hypothetical protein B0T15DRAFT_559038 [Chaetomium strumarium]